MPYKNAELAREWEKKYRARPEVAERARVRSREWYKNNSVRAAERGRAWRSSDKGRELKRAYQRRSMLTPPACFRHASSSARSRGIEWALSFDQFMGFWQKPCHYCSDPIESCGLDRVDNSVGYSVGNVVPCCKGCNYAKYTGSQDDFIKRCIRVADKFRGRA